jgi:PPP family 3-phenylpropionic acid transporter
MAFAAAAGAVRWSVFAMTANVTAMALVEPSHRLSFALLHLACMRLNLLTRQEPAIGPHP